MWHELLGDRTGTTATSSSTKKCNDTMTYVAMTAVVFSMIGGNNSVVMRLASLIIIHHKVTRAFNKCTLNLEKKK